MTVFRNADAWDQSNVEFVDGEVVAYAKRDRTPRMAHIDYGLSILASDALAHVPPDAPADLEGVYQHLLRRGQLAAVEVAERFYEVGSFDGMQDFAAYLAGRVATRIGADR